MVKGKIATLFAGMNGVSHWAKEWANTVCAAASTSTRPWPCTTRPHHPAEYYDDGGAAAGPVMTLVITQ